MKTSNSLINLCATICIFLGLNIMLSKLMLNITYFGIDFMIYLFGGIGFVIGLLTLFREGQQ